MMEANITITNAGDSSPAVSPDADIRLISTVQLQVLGTIMNFPAFGLPIMREDFITGTGPLRDARPIKQL
jgi:hypothetical protein